MRGHQTGAVPATPSTKSVQKRRRESGVADIAVWRACRDGGSCLTRNDVGVASDASSSSGLRHGRQTSQRLQQLHERRARRLALSSIRVQEGEPSAAARKPLRRAMARCRAQAPTPRRRTSSGAVSANPPTPSARTICNLQCLFVAFRLVHRGMPERVRRHNSGPGGHTESGRPWSVLVSIEFRTERDARRFET